MSINRIADQFNRAASSYTSAAVVQLEVGKRLIERLEDIRLQPRTIIDLGCGTGTQCAALAARYPEAHIIGVDFSEKMLKQAALLAPYTWVNAHAEHLPFADNSVDLIFSNVMLQWCDPFMPVLQECYRVLAEGGLFVFSYFGPDTLQELRYSWAQIDDYPHVNEFVDMHPIGDGLLQSHFNDPVMDMEYIKVTYGDVVSLMRDLQKIGATYCSPNRRKTLTGKHRYRQLSEHYQVFATPENRLPATYEVVYGSAWKLPRPETLATHEVFVPVGEIGRR